MRCTGLIIWVSLVIVCAGRGLHARPEGFDLEYTQHVLKTEIQGVIHKEGIASISISLVRGGDIVWSYAAGYANVGTLTEASAETYYCTGSTFKAVTATALMQLVESGRLQIDSPVNEYLDHHQIEQLTEDKPVTLRHVLSHWSGLEKGEEHVLLWGRQSPRSLSGIVSGLRPARGPEEEWEYNNYGYALLGLIVEETSGMEFEDYVCKNILEPLGIDTPGPVYPTPEMVELMALPYVPADGKPVPTPQLRYDTYPAGDIYLRAEDMARFLGAHLNGGVFNGHRILEASSVQQMHTPQFGGEYGLGFQIGEDENGHTIIAHTGGIPGYTALMIGDIDARVGVYMMSTSLAPSFIAGAALRLLRGEEYSRPGERTVVEVDSTTLEEYVGSYLLSGSRIIKVTRKGSRLFAQMSRPHPTELFAETESKFFLKDRDAQFVFIRDDQGRVERVLVQQGGMGLSASKVR